MKHLIIKLIFFIIIFSLGGLNTVKACEPATDEQYYQHSLFINDEGETVVRYKYKKNVVEILVPRTRLDFLRLDAQFRGWQINTSHKYFRTLYINMMLIKYWLEPLYY